MQEAYRAYQKKKAEDLNKEKEEMKKAQVERERFMEEKYEKWKRKQKEMIEAEKQHQRILAEEAKKGLKRFHDEYERQMALDRERLAKEEELLSIARLEYERCQEEERDRFKQSQASYERAMKEDRQRMAQEMNAFAKAQKKWDNDRAVFHQNYDKLQSKLNEGYQQLQRDQQAMEKRLQRQMENLMDEQKNLTDFEKEQQLKDLTVTFLDYCQMYSNDPVKLTKETKIFQRKFNLQLTIVRNSMKTGDESLPRLDVWTEGAVLAMTIFKYLYDSGEIKSQAIQVAFLQYQSDMCALVSKFNASGALPCNVTELQAIQNSFDDRVQVLENSINRALPDSTSPLLAIQTPTAKESSILSPAIINKFAVAGEGVSAASSLHHESEIMTQSEGASRLPGSDI